MNCEVIQFQNKTNLLDLTFSLRDDCLSVVIEAFIFFLKQSSVEVEKRTYRVNE